MLALAVLAYLYAFWLAYILVMGLYRAHLARRLCGLAKMMALPVVLVGWAMDVATNWLIAPLVFLDPPREALVTERLKRYKKTDAGWRAALADWICESLLDVFDPTGDHC